MGKARASLTEYEKLRNARIEQNKTKLQEFGIHNIAASLSSSVQNQKRNKRKEKATAQSSKDDAGQNVPDFSDESEDEIDTYNLEKFKKAKQLESQQNVRFIPPRTMNRYSNLAKQGLRTKAADLSFNSLIKRHVVQEQGQDGQLELSQTHQRQEGRVKVTQNCNGKKITMADLILQKNTTQLVNESDKSSRLTYNKRQESSSDLRLAEMAISARLGESNEDLYNEANPKTLNDQEPEVDKELDILTDSDEERFAHYNNEILEDTSESSHENNQAEEGNDAVNPNSRDLELDAIFKGKTRGPTMLHRVHMRSYEKRKAIVLNEFGQPVGPKTEDEDTVAEFSRFLGTIARDYSCAPLVFDSWRKVPNKEKMWEYVLSKYIVPYEGKDWVIKTIATAWRGHKCRFKKKHYYAYTDNKTRWQHRSRRVPDDDFMKLLTKWKKKSEQARCSRNRDHRLAQKNMHTVGPKSFAIIREEMKNEHPNKEAPSLAELFERTRRRNEGKNYNISFEDTSKKIDEMKNYIAPEDESGPSDAFLAVMGKDYNGHRRLYGRGVTTKKLVEVNGSKISYVVPGELMDSLKASVSDDVRRDMDNEIDKVDAIRRQMEEEHLNKKMELENMQKELEKEREAMTEQVLRKLLEKLPIDIAKQFLSS